MAGVLTGLSACAGLPPGDETVPVVFDQGASLRAVNALRAANGRPALAIDARLTQAATAQSAAMAARDRMDHVLAGRLPERVEAVGYDWSTVAENIGKGYRTYDAAMAGWVASPGHRRNMLNADVTAVGFGAARDTKGGRTYWTQVFAAPKAGSLADRPAGRAQSAVRPLGRTKVALTL